VNALEQEHSEFAASFNYAQAITAWRFRVPFWRHLLPKKRLLQEVRNLEEFVYRIIDNAMARENARAEERAKNPGSEKEEGGKGGHATLLDHFLAEQQEYEFTREYLRDMLLNFLLAGRDTVRSLAPCVAFLQFPHLYVANACMPNDFPTRM